MRQSLRLYVVVFVAFLGIAGAQQFEVASVKPAKAPEGMEAAAMRAQDGMYEMMSVEFVPLKGMTLVAHGRTLAQLVGIAFKVKPSLVTGPSWITELRYDVDAKLPEGSSTKDAHAMLKHLLEERFALRTHPDTKTTGGYALVVAKDGPKLTPAGEAPPAPLDQEEMRKRAQDAMQKRMEEMRKSGTPMRGGSSWHSFQATGAQIAEAVGRMIRSPVADETGLKGKYDVRIEMLPGESPDDTPEYRMSLGLAKLGLKLESKKAEITLLVVDSASKTPTEN